MARIQDLLSGDLRFCNNMRPAIVEYPCIRAINIYARHQAF